MLREGRDGQRSLHTHSWVSPITGTLPRLLCAPVDQQRLAQPPEPAVMHHKRLCTGFHLGLALSLQGAEMIPHQAPSQWQQMSLLPPQTVPAVPKATWEPIRQGGLPVESPWQRGNGIREGNSKASLNTSHVPLCFPSVPARVKRPLGGIAHLLADLCPHPRPGWPSAHPAVLCILWPSPTPRGSQPSLGTPQIPAAHPGCSVREERWREGCVAHAAHPLHS